LTTYLVRRAPQRWPFCGRFLNGRFERLLRCREFKRVGLEVVCVSGWWSEGMVSVCGGGQCSAVVVSAAAGGVCRRSAWVVHV
jgi:hypothetical protein